MLHLCQIVWHYANSFDNTHKVIRLFFLYSDYALSQMISRNLEQFRVNLARAMISQLGYV